jgi:hypothetical protein
MNPTRAIVTDHNRVTPSTAGSLTAQVPVVLPISTPLQRSWILPLSLGNISAQNRFHMIRRHCLVPTLFFLGVLGQSIPTICPQSPPTMPPTCLINIRDNMAAILHHNLLACHIIHNIGSQCLSLPKDPRHNLRCRLEARDTRARTVVVNLPRPKTDVAMRKPAVPEGCSTRSSGHNAQNARMNDHSPVMTA